MLQDFLYVESMRKFENETNYKKQHEIKQPIRKLHGQIIVDKRQISGQTGLVDNQIDTKVIDKTRQYSLVQIITQTKWNDDRIIFQLGMDRIAVLPDIRPSGYPAILKTGYRISGRISGGCRIPDISMPVCCSAELLK